MARANFLPTDLLPEATELPMAEGDWSTLFQTFFDPDFTALPASLAVSPTTPAVFDAVLETVSIPCMVAACFFCVSAIQLARRSDDDSTIFGEKKSAVLRWLVLMLLNNVVAWVLWIPAGFMGLSYDSMDDFPTGYMLLGAIFGHAQALVNPYIFGFVWRHWIISSRDDPSAIKLDNASSVNRIL